VQEQAPKRQKELRMLLVKKPIHVIVRVRSQQNGHDRHGDDDNDEPAKELPHLSYCIGWIPLFVNSDYALFTQFSSSFSNLNQNMAAYFRSLSEILEL
jgi:hypothetical protein